MFGFPCTAYTLLDDRALYPRIVILSDEGCLRQLFESERLIGIKSWLVVNDEDEREEWTQEFYDLVNFDPDDA